MQSFASDAQARRFILKFKKDVESVHQQG